jgi:hypothetical protein
MMSTSLPLEKPLVVLTVMVVAPLAALAVRTAVAGVSCWLEVGLKAPSSPAPKSEQAPLTQLPLHTAPQPPQLLGSVLVLVLQPLLGLPVHAAKPALHTTKQVLLEQMAVALLAPGQTLPQPLQLFGSKRGSTHEPLHATSGEAQLAVHVPLEHTWPVVHLVPHAPQLVASVMKLVQKALVPLPQRLGVAVAQAHAPLVQN